MPWQLEQMDQYIPEAIYGQDLRQKMDRSDGDRWTLNFGPQHPATHTTLRLVLELDGERVIGCVPYIGYLHSGFEKLGEHLNYNQYVTVVERMNYTSPVLNDIAWHHAVEKLFQIEITPRCKVLRTILGELSRISDHLLCAAAQAIDLGGLTAFLYAFNAREAINDITEWASGARYHPSWTRVGGLNRDIPEGWVQKVKLAVDSTLPRAMDDLETLLNRNRLFVERTRGIGVVTREDAIAYSISGPIARAAGVVRDLRKDEPYLCFADGWDAPGGTGGEPAVSFKVPIMQSGDVYARYLVRLAEARQSLAIVKQLIDRIPPGPVNVAHDEKLILPGQDDRDPASVYGSIEGLIHHFENVMINRGLTPPIGEVYGCIESPNGELGYFITSDASPTAYRARTRPPSFINYQLFDKVIVGHQISDVVVVLGSFSIIAAELDR